MADSTIKSDAKAVILDNTASSLYIAVQNGWSLFPKGKPFICRVSYNGQFTAWGHIYNDGTYGEVLFAPFSEGNLYYIRRVNGAFYGAKLLGTTL